MQKWFFTVLSAGSLFLGVWWGLNLFWDVGEAGKYVAALFALAVLFRGAATP